MFQPQIHLIKFDVPSQLCMTHTSRAFVTFCMTPLIVSLSQEAATMITIV